MEFLRKVWDWLGEPRAMLWCSGFFASAGLDYMAEGKTLAAVLCLACACFDAWHGLRRLQVTA